MFGGVSIVESPLATLLPSAQPRTLDMQEMVDHFRNAGMIQARPSMFQIGGVLFVHPTLVAQIRKRVP